MDSTNNEGKKVCILSILSLIVSIVAVILYAVVLKVKWFAPVWPVWIILSIISVIMPAIAKKVRIDKEQEGNGFEIAALIIGGFAIYCVVFAATSWNIFVGYLGYVIGGIMYKLVDKWYYI